MDNIIKSSINKIRNFVSSRINDQQGLIQRNPQTGVRTINIPRPVAQAAQTAIRSIPGGNIALQAPKIASFVQKPFKALELRSPEIIKAAGTGDYRSRLLRAFPKAAEIAGQEFIGSVTGGGAPQKKVGQFIGSVTGQVAKPIPQLGVGLAQLTTKDTRREGLKNIALGTIGAGLSAAGLTRLAAPAFAAVSGGIGGAIGGGSKLYENIVNKRPLGEGLSDAIIRQAGESTGRGIQMSSIVKFTQPAIEKIGRLAQTSTLFNRLPPVAKQQVLDRMIGSVLNVGEGLIIDRALGLTTDKTSVSIDAIVGTLMGTRAVPGQNRALRQAFKDLNKRATDIFNAELKRVRERPGIAELRFDEIDDFLAKNNKETIINKANELKKQGEEILLLQDSQNEAIKDQISRLSAKDLQDLSQLRRLASTKQGVEGDIETLYRLNPDLTQRVVTRMRELLNEYDVPLDFQRSDIELIDYALSLPAKSEIRTEIPEELKVARELLKKLQQVEPIKEKVVKPEIKTIEPTITDPLLQEARKYKSAEEFVNSRIKRFHQTSPEAEKLIEKGGFRVGLEGSGRSDILPTGVNTKGTDQTILIQGRGSQMELGVSPNINIKQFVTRDQAEKYFYYHDLGENYRKYVDAMKKADIESAREVDRLLAIPTKTKAEAQQFIDEAKTVLDVAEKDILKYSKLAREEADKIVKRDGIDAIQIDNDLGGFNKKVDNLIIFDPSKVKTKSQLTDIWNQAQQIKTKTIEPILKKDGTIEVKTTQPTVEMPKNMSTIADIFQNRQTELLSTFKTPDEIKLKYKGEKRIKVSGSETKNKLINAFKNQSPKTFDLEKADTALNYVTNKINDKRLKQIINESGINRLEKNSFKNFWNLVRKELSQNPAYKEDYDAIWKSLLDSENYFNTKNEVVKPNKKLIPIKEEIDLLSTFPSKTQVYGKEAEINYKNYVEKANNIIQRISNGLKFYKIGKKEFIRYIENPNTAPENISEIIDFHKYLMDIAHASRENPMLGKIESYYPHMSDESLTKRQDIKRLGEDLWISSTNMQLGTALKRLGVMKEYSLEYEKVMRNYFEQAAYEKYGSRIKFNEQTNNFVNKLETHLKRDSEGLLERPNNNFDYIEESALRQNVETKKPIFARFLPTDTFDSLRRKIERDTNGKKLSYTMALLRDSDDQINNFIKEADGKDLQTQIKLYKRIDTKGRNIVKERDRLTTNELILLGNYEKKYRLQNFIDEVGKFDFEDNVKNYLNKEIDRLTKKGEYEQSLATQLSNFITGLAYRAQIWFNVNTALLQKSEVIRLPVLYSPQTIKQGAEQYLRDLTTGRDILKQYDFNNITTDQTKFLGEENVLVNNKVGKLKQFGKNVDEITGKFGNFLIDLTENSKNRDFLYTMEAEGKSLGLQGEALYRFVRNEMFANSFILHEFNTPEIIRNPFFRVLLQYMQYPIKMYSRAWELGTTNPDIVKGVTQGAALIGTQGVAAILLAYITGKSLEKLNETFTDALTIKFGPIPTTLFNLAKSGKELYDNEVDRDKTEEQKQNSREYIQNQIKRYLISTGIPGSNQWRKTTGALSVINKGYDETFGGNITYPSPENKFDQIRGLLFGKTSFPENKEYYRATQDVTEFGGKRLQEAYSIGTNEFSREKAELIRELYKKGKREEGRNVIELERRIQKARKESYDALTDIEKQALNSIPKQEPDDIQARMTKYRNMIQYPAIYDKKKFDALVAANGDLTKVDPLYTYNYEHVYKYMLYQSFGGSTLDSSNADELFKANPVILEISKARAEFFKNNPIEALTQDSLRPLPSQRAQALMNAKMWDDPEVQAYLQANREYKNYIRGKLGMPTIEESEFLSGKGGRPSGRRAKVKKVTFGRLKKIKLKKPKAFKFKKLKLPKIKPIEAPRTKVSAKKGRIRVKIPKLPKTPKAKVV